jgi:hypothetical protein
MSAVPLQAIQDECSLSCLSLFMLGGTHRKLGSPHYATKCSEAFLEFSIMSDRDISPPSGNRVPGDELLL